MDTQTNVWLGVIAIVSVLQFGAMLTVAIVVAMKVKRAEMLVESGMSRIERVTNEAIRDLRPVVKQAEAMIEDVRDLSARVRQLDNQVQHGVAAVSSGVRFAGNAALSKLWPAASVLHAIASGARALRARRERAREREERKDIARFTNEGGAHG